jgi:hypothetical protein
MRRTIAARELAPMTRRSPGIIEWGLHARRAKACKDQAASWQSLARGCRSLRGPAGLSHHRTLGFASSTTGTPGPSPAIPCPAGCRKPPPLSRIPRHVILMLLNACDLLMPWAAREFVETHNHGPPGPSHTLPRQPRAPPPPPRAHRLVIAIRAATIEEFRRWKARGGRYIMKNTDINGVTG